MISDGGVCAINNLPTCSGKRSSIFINSCQIHDVYTIFHFVKHHLSLNITLRWTSPFLFLTSPVVLNRNSQCLSAPTEKPTYSFLPTLFSIFSQRRMWNICAKMIYVFKFKMSLLNSPFYGLKSLAILQPISIVLSIYHLILLIIPIYWLSSAI